MNVYAVVILAALLVGFALDAIATALNLRCLGEELPEEFRDVYDPEAYRKSQRYTRDRARLGLVSSAIGLGVLLAFWFAGGFDGLDRVVRSWGLGPVLTGLAYIGILAVARAALQLPFSAWSTFVIEERYGFNRTTPRTFVVDLLKALLLTTAIGGLLVGALLFLFVALGPRAWLLAWGVTALFTLALNLVVPTWILPLFNRFTPLEDGELRKAILAYAGSVRFPIENVFVVDGSRRSSKTNAFFSGFGRSKRLALFDTLIAGHTVAELVAIFAHEVGHHKRRHVVQGLAISVAHAGVMFFLLSVFITHHGLFDAFFMERPSVHAGFVFFGLLYAPVELVLSILLHLFSRRNEFQADRFAATTISDGEEMASALKKLARENLTNLTPHPFHVLLNHSHPPILERIRAIRAVAPRRVETAASARPDGEG